MPASKNSKPSRTSKPPAAGNRSGSGGGSARVSRGKPGSKKKSVSSEERPWKLIAFLGALSAAAMFFFWRGGYLLWFGDAAAHMNIARRIIDGRSPGYEQIGTVWLPLPHLLMLPFASIDSLWRSGLAGSIPNALCWLAAALLLYGAARKVYDCDYAAAAAALLFALNPNMLYLQSIPMTEAIFACSLALTLYGTVRGSGVLTGCGLLAGTMTRYEGWFLIPFAVLYLLRFRFAEAVKAGVIASIGPVYWLAHNAYIYSDPFEFYHGVGSAKWIYEQALAKGLERAPGDGDFLLAAKYYAAAGRLFAGLPLILIGAVGAAAALVRRAWWPLVFFALGPVFYAWSIHGSGATIFVPTLHPHTYYNTRYGMIALPMAAFAAAAIPSILPLGNRKFIVAVLVAIGVSPWVFYPRMDGWVVWKESEVNSISRRAWTEQAAAYLKPQYEMGTGIVAHFGDQTAILQTAGIPIKQSVHDGNELYFQSIQKRPDLFLWQEWVIAISGDSLSSAMANYAMKLPRYRRVKMVEVKDAQPIEIWRRQR